MKRIAKGIARFCFGITLLMSAAWGALFVVFLQPIGQSIRLALLVLLGLATVVAIIGIARRRWRLILPYLGIFLLLLVGWFGVAPSNDRNWQRDVARLPTAQINGNIVTIRNVRNFEYRSEFDYVERWETRSYDLSKVHGLDLFVVYWGSPSIAHTILSWEFEDGQHLAISIETRKEVGERYSALRGFFRQYELYYVVAEEQDVIGVRTNHRHEDVYLYRLRTPPARARALLLDYLQAVNRLALKPKWYNALTDNCTTTIRLHVRNIVGGVPQDLRWLANGYLDEALYTQGIISREFPFSRLKAMSYVNPKAQAIIKGADFSKLIRVGLPTRPAPPKVN